MLFYSYSYETLSPPPICSQVYCEVFPFDIGAVFQTMLVDTVRIRLKRFQLEKKKKADLMTFMKWDGNFFTRTFLKKINDWSKMILFNTFSKY